MVTNRRTTNILGLGLILLGGLALLNNTFLGWIGLRMELWPLWITAVGMAFIAAPFLAGNPRQLAPLFIPGFPILMVSLLLVWDGVFWWGAWATFWPTILLALALGFAATAVFMRIVWFLIPAIKIGVLGMILQFTAVTGWWDSWAVLWPALPFSTGLALLVCGHLAQKPGLVKAGMIISFLSAGLFVMMTTILSGGVSLLGGLILIGGGSVMVLRGMLTGERPLALSEKEIEEKLPIA
ncbi:MAG: hypothetical protein KJ069_06055 [Anaerolineae bacterium]|nr:hypothetical protein [Anaerolineae bacterium]